MTRARKTVGICLHDGLLRKFLCEGLRRHTTLAISTFARIEEMLPATNLAVAVFDVDGIDASAFTDQNVVSLRLVDGKAGTGVSAQGVLTLPLRLGVFVDTIYQNMRAATHDKSFLLGSWLVSPDGSTLSDSKKGATVRLTEKERDILMKLREKRGGIVERKELLNEIWGYGKEIETHTLETHIYRLRQKIEHDPAKPRWLITEDAGYRLELSGTPDHSL